MSAPEGSQADAFHPQSGLRVEDFWSIGVPQPGDTYAELEHRAKVSRLANHFRSIQQRVHAAEDPMAVVVPEGIKDIELLRGAICSPPPNSSEASNNYISDHGLSS